jgi:hypothetical protein
MSGLVGYDSSEDENEIQPEESTKVGGYLPHCAGQSHGSLLIGANTSR